MRTAEEMMQLIMDVAQNDERVRAVYMNGSRANPRAKHDLFQDFDIVYVTRDITGMLADRTWLQAFGTPLVHQEPDAIDVAVGATNDPERDGYTIMNVFTDGNRIDLHLEPVAVCAMHYGEDSQTVPLLDKDGLLRKLSVASDRDHWVTKPSAALFYHHTNDFWWVAPYVAKGLWRGELLYANSMLDILRGHLLDVCDWQVGSERDWQISTGKEHKDLVHLLPPDTWQALTQTYTLSSIDDTWSALTHTLDLFSQLASEVATALGFEYASDEEQGSRQYVQAIRDLAPNATTMVLPE